MRVHDRHPHLERRIAGATRADVQHALWRERTLVKTFGPAAIGDALAELTTRQRLELDDEVSLVGAVMEATPTLTVAP